MATFTMISEPTLPDLPSGFCSEKTNSRFSTATPQDEENSEAFKYKILYNNDAGELIRGY